MTCLLLAMLLTVPTDYEARMLADARDGHFDTLPLETAAMIAAGPKQAASIASAMLLLKRKLVPAIEAAREVDASERPRLLLQLLHVSLLKRYSENATSLYDVVVTGRFNALSASLLYLLAAEHVGVEAQAVLRDGKVLIRATQTLDPTRPQAELADEDDVAVDCVTLLALIYAHKATTVDDPRPLMKKAAALDQKDLAREYSLRLLLGGPHGARALAIDDAERIVLKIVDQQSANPEDVEAWGARLEPFTNIRYEALAKLYLKVGDLSGAAFAIELGRKTCTDCSALTALDLQRLTIWSASDGIGAANAFLASYAIETAPATIADNYVQALLGEQRCSDAQSAATQWKSVLTDEIETCFVQKGEALMRAKRFDDAAAQLRTAVNVGPQVQKALLGAVSQQAMTLIKQKRCGDAKVWLEEGLRLEPSEAFFSEGLKYCAGQTAWSSKR